MRSAASHAVHDAYLPCSSLQSGASLQHAAATEASNFITIHVCGHINALLGHKWSNTSLNIMLHSSIRPESLQIIQDFGPVMLRRQP